MIALSLLACAVDAPIEPVAPDPDIPTALGPPVVDVGPGTDVDLPADSRPGRPVRRMDVAQIDASIRAATGGIGWDVDGVSQFEVLSGSLGVPDYVQRTNEDLEPGLLFQKFMDDAAQEVCHTLIEREFDGSSTVFLQGVSTDATRATDAAAIDAALAANLLRFHGRRVLPGDPQLDEWSYLFDTTLTVTGEDTAAAWRAVCIGLIVHPDFTQY